MRDMSSPENDSENSVAVRVQNKCKKKCRQCEEENTSVQISTMELQKVPSAHKILQQFLQEMLEQPNIKRRRQTKSKGIAC